MSNAHHPGDMPPVGQADGQHAPHDGDSDPPSFWRSKTTIVLIGFAAIATFLLLSEHRVHALGFLPFLLILACPLMHIFMHHGHGGHGSHEKKPEKSKHPREEPSHD